MLRELNFENIFISYHLFKYQNPKYNAKWKSKEPRYKIKYLYMYVYVYLMFEWLTVHFISI